MPPTDTALTIRNLSPHVLTITSLDRFPLPPAQPLKPTLNNITDFNNLAHNFSSLLNKSPLKHTHLPSLLPSPGPDHAKLSADAQAFYAEVVDVKVGAFATLAGDKSQIKLTKDGKDEILRVTFSNTAGGKWSVDINPQSKVISRQIVTITKPKYDEDYTSAVWHIGPAQLTLVWTPPLNKWMAPLPGTLPLCALSVPGTHNSPTHHVAAPSVRCQAHPIPLQLANGIRFFDIRAQPEQKGTNMWLVHGAFPVSLTGGKHLLTTLLNHVYEFLAANPSETVMVSLKREGPFEVPDATFSKILYEIIAPNVGKWYTGVEIPMLQQCRGKCVLIRRFGLHPEVKEWGIDASSWQYNTPNHISSGGHIQVQDFCEVLAEKNVDQKVEYVTAHIDRAGVYTNTKDTVGINNYSPPPIYLNFLSASNFWNTKCWPDKVAEKVNPAVLDYLALKHNTGRISGEGDCGTGVLVADYVGDKGDWDQIRLCVSMNGLVGDRRMLVDKEMMEKAVRERREKEKKAKEEEERKKKQTEAAKAAAARTEAAKAEAAKV